MTAAKNPKPVCAVCGKPRGLTVPKTLSKDGRARLLEMLLQDDYCSTKCARIAFGNQLPDADGRSYPESEGVT